jgi:hypothetical protein
LLDRIIANRQDAGFNVLLAQSPMLGNGRVALGPVDDVAVPPGRYRLFLISDRPAALRLALPGMPVRSITAEHRSSGTAAVDRAPPATGLPQSVSSVRRDLLARGMVVFQASRWDAPSGGARVYSNVVNTCLAPAGGDCPDDLTDTGMTGVTPSSGPSHVEYAGYADTFDVPERASAITSWRGTDRPSAGKQLVVTFPVV